MRASVKNVLSCTLGQRCGKIHQNSCYIFYIYFIFSSIGVYIIFVISGSSFLVLLINLVIHQVK